MMVAARVGSGIRASQPVGATSARASSAAVIRLASWVLAPAVKFTAEREMLPVTGKPPLRALPRLAAPRPISSRSLCSFSARFRARAWAPDMLIRKTMKPISRAGCSSACQCACETPNVSRGRPAGTVPVVCTPRACRSRSGTSAVAPSTTTIGASLAPMSAQAGASPHRRSSGARWLRASSSRTREPTPSSALGRWMAGSLAPSRTGSWPSAITTEEPMVKPLITGREKKLAMKPMRSSPHSSSTAPDIKASWAASTPYRALPAVASGARLEAVISEMIAIGPTDCVLLVPNSAYRAGGTMLA